MGPHCAQTAETKEIKTIKGSEKQQQTKPFAIEANVRVCLMWTFVMATFHSALIG